MSIKTEIISGNDTECISLSQSLKQILCIQVPVTPTVGQDKSPDIIKDTKGVKRPTTNQPITLKPIPIKSYQPTNHAPNLLVSRHGCDEHCICVFICTCFEVYLFLGEVAQYEMSKDRQAAEQRGLYRDKVILILSFATVMVLMSFGFAVYM